MSEGQGHGEERGKFRYSEPRVDKLEARGQWTSMSALGVGLWGQEGSGPHPLPPPDS